MVEGIVLAAGRSRRAGTFKALHRHRDQPLLAHALASLAPLCGRLVVVTGHRHGEIEALLAGSSGLETVRNPFPDKDMFCSVRIGARAVSPAAEAFFLLPTDCPFVPGTVPRALLAAYRAEGGRRPVLPERGGRGGHPVLLPQAARTAILAAEPGTTLRDVLRALDAQRLPVDSDEVLRDLDRPADLLALATAERGPAHEHS